MSENVEELRGGVSLHQTALLVGGLDPQRPIDLVLTALALIFLAPLMAVIALAIWLSDRGPVFFGHTRLGYGGESFRCWKFRSMAVDADQILNTHLVGNPLAQAEWDRD